MKLGLAFFTQVQDKQRQIIQLQNILRENEDKVNAMSEHLKNVRQELQHTQVCMYTQFKQFSLLTQFHKCQETAAYRRQ